ncbi:TorD/DmsD family molecular chaperone [Rhodopseudomonas palustris]|uniref:TorD/DmsD family molecular chaperone n=1 Tax=Rhodopseudomonas palustris TaxID=1076 RepID=UPI0002F18956
MLWLAAVFAAPPSRDSVASYRRGEAAVWLGELARQHDLAEGVAQIRDVLAAELDDEALTARLGIAFGRLFSGIGGPDAIAPYESAFRCGGRPFQAPTAEMDALLAAHDVSVATGLAEPADHVSVELSLLSQLIATDDPGRFALQQRLCGWIPDFCAACHVRDHRGFWGGAAMLLTALLTRDTSAPTTGRSAA